ncbi:MAG: ATP-binding protein [Cognatishimia activa]
MFKSRFAKALLLAAAAIVCLFQVGLFAHNMTNRISTLTGPRPDQAPWALGQLEAEYHRLNASLRSDFGAPLDTTQIRLLYDIFYSRVTVLVESKSFASHRDNPRFSTPLENIEAYLGDTVRYFANGDDGLRKDLPALARRTQAVGPDVRKVALMGFQINWAQADAREMDARRLIFWNSAQTGLLFLLLLLMAAGFYRQDSARRRALQEVSRTKARIEAILKSNTDAVIVCSHNGKVQEMNEPGHAMFGIAEAAEVGLDLHDLLQATSPAKDFSDPRDSGFLHKERVETQATRADGTRFPVAVSLTQVKTDTETALYVAHVRDISRRVNSQRALREAHDEAKASEKAKSDLLAVMSHETRTPLNGILGASELLKKSMRSEKQLRLVAAIETSAKLLLHHVNNVLDVSRMDAGQDDLRVAQFDLRQLIRDVMESQQARATQSDLTLLADIAEDLPPSVMGDAQKIRQILLNLVGNAIKFTDEGSVIVEVELIGDGPIVEFRIMDTGAGIESRQLENIFEDFFTADSTYARRREGSGLGLGIVKRIVEAMGGDVGAESVLGEGSLFWVRLPLPTETGEIEGTVCAEEKDKSLSILLVEDNAINRMITQQMLFDAGHFVDLAEDGTVGAQMAAQTAYDLILMDISMPGMDGIETAQKIRADKGLSSATPIVALTAYSRDEDLGRVKAAGIHHILTKPTSESALEAMILKVMGDMFLRTSSHIVSSTSAALLDEEVAESVMRGLGHIQAEANLKELERDMQALLSRLSSCSSAEDLDLEEIHRLTGSTGVMGMAKLRKHLIRAEAMELGDPQDLQLWIQTTQTLWDDTHAAYLSFLKGA